jgi:hypothetical protein
VRTEEYIDYNTKVGGFVMRKKLSLVVLLSFLFLSLGQPFVLAGLTTVELPDRGYTIKELKTVSGVVLGLAAKRGEETITRLFYSQDGLTWKASDLPFQTFPSAEITIDLIAKPDSAICVSDHEGAKQHYVSYDGVKWSSLAENNDVEHVTIKAGSAVFQLRNRSLYGSMDDGRSFTNQVAYDVVDWATLDNAIIVLDESGTVSKISPDGSKTKLRDVTSIANLKKVYNKPIVGRKIHNTFIPGIDAVTDENGNNIILVYDPVSGELWVSKGDKWEKAKLDKRVNIAAVSKNGTIFAATSDDLKASNDCETWKTQKISDIADLVVLQKGDNDTAVAVTNYDVRVWSRQLPVVEPVEPPVIEPPVTEPPVTKPSPVAVFRIGDSNYYLDGQAVKMDGQPSIIGGRTLVPVRYLANALGVTDVGWDQATQKVTLKGVELTIGSKTLISNGASSQMDVAPSIISGRTYLPARYVAEALGYEVGWDAANQVVYCWPKGEPKPDIVAIVAGLL